MHSYTLTCPKRFTFSFLTTCAHRCCSLTSITVYNTLSILYSLIQRCNPPCVLSLSLHFKMIFSILHFKMIFSIPEILQTCPLVLWYFIHIDFCKSKHLYVSLPSSINYISIIPYSSECLSSFTWTATVDSWLVFLLPRPATSFLVHSLPRNKDDFLNKTQIWACQSLKSVNDTTLG